MSLISAWRERGEKRERPLYRASPSVSGTLPLVIVQTICNIHEHREVEQAENPLMLVFGRDTRDMPAPGVPQHPHVVLADRLLKRLWIADRVYLVHRCDPSMARLERKGCQEKCTVMSSTREVEC